jgi:hypothetical protein
MEFPAETETASGGRGRFCGVQKTFFGDWPLKMILSLSPTKRRKLNCYLTGLQVLVELTDGLYKIAP